MQGYYPTLGMSLHRSHRDAGRPSSATCARCLRRSPIATISSPWCCPTARTGGGNGGWWIWPRRCAARARSIWRPAPATSRLAWRPRAHDVVGLDVTLRMIELARAKMPTRGAAALHRRRHAGVAVSRRLVRCRDDRLRPAQRARSGHGDRGDLSRGEAGRSGRCRSISTGRRIAACGWCISPI